MTFRSVRRFALATLLSLLFTGCGDDSNKESNAANSLGTDAGTNTDTGGETDAGVDSDAALECADDEYPIDGECLEGGLNIITLGFVPDTFNGTGSFVSWAADDGPVTTAQNVTATCLYQVVQGSGVAPTAPDCLDAGPVTLTVDGESEQVEQGEDCYATNFEMDRDWGGKTIDVSAAGGADIGATSFSLNASEGPEVSAAMDGDDVVLTRANFEANDDPLILLIPEGDGPNVQCTETSPGELRLSPEDVAAIQALEGQHTDLIVIHASSESANSAPYFLNVAVQNQQPVLNFLPSEQ